MKRLLKLASINISVICLLVVTLELSGQLIFYLVKGYALWDLEHRQVFELHPYLAGRLKKVTAVSSGHKTITTTDLHTRYTGKPFDKDTIRVAALGGSTTFGTGVGDLDSWPALLQEMLGEEYSVVNYGVPGYSSAEAIIQLALTVPEIRPHFVIVYEGWNDIRNYHETGLEPDYYSHGMMQYDSLQIPIWRTGSIFTRLSEVSSIFHFIRKTGQWARERGGTLGTDRKASREPDPYVDRLYQRNLHEIKILIRDMNAHALFVPQVINYDDFRGKKSSRDWTPHIEDDALPDLLQKFNLKMNSACQTGDPKCTVVNDVAAVRWTRADFVDDGHFSRQGGEKFARILARQIERAVEKHPRAFHVRRALPAGPAVAYHRRNNH